jgi:RHS repeat-associated protein
MEQASSAFSTGVPALAAIPQLAGNSRQGFQPVASTSRWGFSFSIFSNTLGLSTSLYDGDAGSRSTGKERDAESGNDYFGARYYASTMGRFMSPDWAAKASPVPYATFGDPQSLNLYAYMRNNPLGGADPDGHCDIGCQFSIVMGIVNGIRRDGSVGAYAKNVGTGILKGAGSTVVNAVKMANAGTNPGAIAAAVLSPGPAALQPSNTTQAQASMATQIVLPAAAGMAAGPLLGAAGAGDAAAGEGASFFHYGYMADESYFAGGLRAGSFATTDGGLTGADAQSTLALPHATVPDAVYPVTPEPGTPMVGPTTVQPEFGQPGGGQQVQFPQGTGPGTVGPPKPVPPQ